MAKRIRILLYQILRLYWRWWKPTVLGARAIVLRDGEVLLVKMSYTDGWCLPGGGVDRGESFKTAIVRELQEECAIIANDPRLFGLYHSTKTGKTDHVAIFVITQFDQDPTTPADPEIQEMRFYPAQELPGDTTPATRRRISEYLNASGGAGPALDQW